VEDDKMAKKEIKNENSATSKKVNVNKNSSKKNESKRNNKKNNTKSSSVKPVKKDLKKNIAVKKDIENVTAVKETIEKNIDAKETKNVSVKETIVKENAENQCNNLKATKENKKILGIFEKVVILVAVALVFSLLGYFIGNNHSENQKDYSTSTKDLQVFIEQYNKILDEYYEDVDKDELIKGAISGMLSTLDDYSQVIDDSSNNFTITLEGSYEGLGVEVVNDSNGNIVVYNVYDDTPAKKAGLQVYDIITKLNDTDLKNSTTKEFVSLVSSEDSIKLTVLRDDEELSFDLKKDKIVLKSVSYEMLENSIGYIKVDIFANNTQDQFKEALEALENQNMKSLIIDLRDNTGGHLSTAKEMISLFLDSSHVIYQTETKQETLKFYSKGNKTKDYNIVILQNEYSASASEIMASALKEQLNAYIIGKTSFGKGTVQQLETIEGLGQYKFTTKKWLTSNGTWIDGKGITPDLEVSLDENYYKNPTKENDSQLQAAIEYLNEK
jgi:carboxyl-terminal processing protease